MNLQNFLFLSVTLFILSCSFGESSVKEVASSTPEEAITNYEKAITSYSKEKSISVNQGVVTKELGDFYSLEDKYKKRKKDENYESEYGKNWRVASQKAEKVTSESVADMKAYYEGGK